MGEQSGSEPGPGSGPRSLAAIMVGGLAALAAAALWGGGAVVSRHLVTTALPVHDLALLRYVGCFPIAALLLLIPDLRRAAWPVKRLLIVLLLAGPPYQALLIWGYVYTTAGVGSLLVTGLLPVFSVLLVLIGCGGHERSAPLALAGAGTSVAGLLLLVDQTATSVPLEGLVIFIVAAAMWAILNILVRRWALDPLQVTVTLAIGSPLFLPLWFMMQDHSALTGALDAEPALVVLQIAYHGVLVAIVATLLSFVAVRRLGVAAAGIALAATPAFAAVIGAVLLEETLTNEQSLAFALTLLGIVLALTGARQRSGNTGSRHRIVGAAPAATGKVRLTSVLELRHNCF